MFVYIMFVPRSWAHVNPPNPPPFAVRSHQMGAAPRGRVRDKTGQSICAPEITILKWGIPITPQRLSNHHLVFTPSSPYCYDF